MSKRYKAKRRIRYYLRVKRDLLATWPMFDTDEDDQFGDGIERSYCNTCGNLGTVNCFCGGDLCVCENNGEMPCPDCGD